MMGKERGACWWWKWRIVTYETVQIVHDGRNKSDYDEQAETAMGDYNKCANRSDCTANWGAWSEWGLERAIKICWKGKESDCSKWMLVEMNEWCETATGLECSKWNKCDCMVDVLEEMWVRSCYARIFIPPTMKKNSDSEYKMISKGLWMLG
jgi:hypothetical protein